MFGSSSTNPLQLSKTTPGTSMFGGTTSSFGGGTGTTTFGGSTSTTSGNLFGGGSSTTGTTSGGLFGGGSSTTGILGGTGTSTFGGGTTSGTTGGSTGGGMFGGSTSGGMFGGGTSGSSTTGTGTGITSGLFGGIGTGTSVTGATTTTPLFGGGSTTGGIFGGGISSGTTGGGTTTSGLFGGNGPTSTLSGGSVGLYGNSSVNSYGNGQSNYMTNNNQPLQLNYTLQNNNSLKYEKLGNILDENQKKTAFEIHQKLNDNDILLENNIGHYNELEETKKIMLKECSNLLVVSKALTANHKNCKLIVEGLERDLNEQISELNKVKKNFGLLENNSSVKINCPSDFFEKIIKDLSFKVDHINHRLNELESLVNMSGKDEEIDKDSAIRATIMAAFAFLNEFSEQNKIITEKVRLAKIKYFEVMLAHGMSEKDIELRAKRYMEKKIISNKN